MDHLKQRVAQIDIDERNICIVQCRAEPIESSLPNAAGMTIFGNLNSTRREPAVCGLVVNLRPPRRTGPLTPALSRGGEREKTGARSEPRSERRVK